MEVPLSLYAILAGALLAMYLIFKVTEAFFFSPLRKIPGPFLARLTPLWLRLVDMSGDRTSTIHQLHQKLGSTILIGPNEISVSDISNVKDLYGQQTNFIKAPVYESMSLPPIGIFSLRDKAAHSQRRRLLSHAFSQSNLNESEPLVLQSIQRLLDILDKSKGQPVDFLNLFRLTAFDVVGDLFLGQSFGGLESGKTPQFLSDMDMYFILSDLQWNNPWIAAFIRHIPLKSVRHFVNSMQRIGDYGERAFRAYVEQYGRSSGRRDLLTKILSVKAENVEAQLSDRQTSVEVGNLVFAGTDTTSMTLTFLFWELARNPTWQNQLREELSGIGTITLLEVQDLPILDAVINEALRLHPAAPASLPRETPRGGKEMNGYFIPEETIVSMQCYTTHRDPIVFPEPQRFLPERWMAPREVSKEMKQLFMPFSKGTRACLGKNLAMMELKLITASLLKRYKFDLAPATTDESMSIKDHFLLMPVGGKCELVCTDR